MDTYDDITLIYNNTELAVLNEFKSKNLFNITPKPLNKKQITQMIELLQKYCRYEIVCRWTDLEKYYDAECSRSELRWSQLMSCYFTQHGKPVHGGKSLKNMFSSTPWYQNAFDDLTEICGHVPDKALAIISPDGI